MTKEDIIRMAREANIKQAIETPHLLMVHELERFAALVAAAERERLAQPQQKPDIYPDEAYELGLERIAYYASPPQRKPLTDEQIKVGWRTLPIQAPMSWSAYLAGARMAEAAHGITGEQHG